METMTRAEIIFKLENKYGTDFRNIDEKDPLAIYLANYPHKTRQKREEPKKGRRGRVAYNKFGYSRETIEKRVIELFNSGFRVKDILERLGIGGATYRKIRKKYGLNRNFNPVRVTDMDNGEETIYDNLGVCAKHLGIRYNTLVSVKLNKKDKVFNNYKFDFEVEVK